METDIAYTVLNENHYPGIIDCVITTFTSGEPMLRALNVSPEEFCYFAEINLKKAITEDFSIVALHEGKVIGSVVSQDFVTEQPVGIEKVTHKMGPIFSLLETLFDNFRKDKEIKQGEYYHMFMASVYKNFSGKKITFKMIEKSHEIAKKHNFKYIIVEATGKTTQYIFESLKGYEEVAKISYSDFKYNGKTVFANISDCEYCKLYIFKLQ